MRSGGFPSLLANQLGLSTDSPPCLVSCDLFLAGGLGGAGAATKPFPYNVPIFLAEAKVWTTTPREEIFLKLANIEKESFCTRNFWWIFLQSPQANAKKKKKKHGKNFGITK